MAENNYTKTSTFELLAEGPYECILESATFGTTPNGTDKIDLKFRIRNDIEQKGKGRYIFDTIWKDKEHPNLFDKRKINKLLGTQTQIKEGTAFNTIDDVLDVLKGALLVVNVGIGFNEYFGEDRNYIKYYSSTKATAKDIVTTNNDIIAIAENDLPF